MLKFFKLFAILAAAAMSVLLSGAALAHGPHARFGFYFGAPLYGPWYYPPPAYYPPYAPVYQSPPVYVERGDVPAAPAAAPAPPQQSYWYFCAASQAYYPYVNECPGGWQRVTPRPPAS
jgi:hypothetical protein